MYEDGLTQSAIRQYHHIADVYNQGKMMIYETAKANAKLNNAPAPEPPMLMVVHEDVIAAVEENGGWREPEVYNKCVTYEAYREAFVVPQPPPPPNVTNPIGAPLRENAPGWFKNAPGSWYQAGMTYTSPEGRKYYLQATITDGPVWYQLS